MAEVVVGLAKTVVEGALASAQTAIDEEALLRQRAQRGLVLITLELQMIHSFLACADKERIRNMMVRTWVRQVREMAYDFQDCIKFVVHLDNRPSWWFRMLPAVMAPPQPLDQAVAEIEELRHRADELTKCYLRYNHITDSDPKLVLLQQQPASSSTATARSARARHSMLTMTRDAAKRQQCLEDLTGLILTKNSKGTDDRFLQVISVWETADGDNDGATSITRKAYNANKPSRSLGEDHASFQSPRLHPLLDGSVLRKLTLPASNHCWCTRAKQDERRWRSHHQGVREAGRAQQVPRRPRRHITHAGVGYHQDILS